MQLRPLHSALLPRPFLGLRLRSSPPTSLALHSRPPPRGCRCGPRGRGRGGEGVRSKLKEKGNIWSVDNDAAMEEEARKAVGRGRGKGRGGRRGRVGREAARKGRGSRVLVSGSMLVEVEKVLQAQEPVIKPKWDTFASGVTGIWKGVGAVFSPLTARIEPIGLGDDEEHLYDCYTLTQIEKEEEPSSGIFHQINRKRSWVPFNPFGEFRRNQTGAPNKSNGHHLSKDGRDLCGDLPRYESFDFNRTDEIDEDFLSMEPGMVFFEDGSYSRGPVDIPVGESDDSEYFLCPTFKFEQCLVKGCHKRLHVVHTIEFADGGSNIEITRLAVYEETSDGPDVVNGVCEAPFDSKPFSQRPRTKPEDLTGSWKVFEVSCTPIFTEEVPCQDGEPPFVYLCTETVKKRSLPENQICFREEEVNDMEEVSILWLPGGVTGYVDVKDDGILCIGVGWYSEEGINLVMERDYGTDGKLKEVRWKSEMKRRWEEPFLVQE